MESKNLSKSGRHSSQHCTNEEDLNKNSKNTQKHQNAKPKNQLSNSKYKIFSRLCNTTQQEDFMQILLLNQENLIFNSKVYQDHIKIYHNFTTLYYISNYYNKGDAQLISYDTNTGKEKIEATDEDIKKIAQGICITQLPNGDLFCFGKENWKTSNTFLINRDLNIHNLPPGIIVGYSSAMYYNRSVYCFGGLDWKISGNEIRFSNRFDLDQNRWIGISPTPGPADSCATAMFKGNILISSQNINIWLYSIGTDSFSIIPHEFNDKRKILINAEEKVYLVEENLSSAWCIYESDIWDEFSWKFILKKFEDNYNDPGEAWYGIYNKTNKSIYILGIRYSVGFDAQRCYWKFNLNKKVLNEVEEENMKKKKKKKKKKKCRVF